MYGDIMRWYRFLSPRERILLALLDGPLFIKEISWRMYQMSGLFASPQVVTGNLGKLIELGLVVDVPAPADIGSRRRYVGLTDDGRRVAEHVRAIAEILGYGGGGGGGGGGR